MFNLRKKPTNGGKVKDMIGKGISNDLLCVFQCSVQKRNYSVAANYFNLGCKKISNETGSNKAQISYIDPKVIYTYPASNADSILVDSSITVKFNTEMDSSTINSSSFIVQNDSMNVPGRVLYSNKEAVFIPSGDLMENTKYTAKVLINAKDAQGRSIDNNYVWNFTTGVAHYVMTLRSTSVTDSARDGTKVMQMGAYMYSYGGWTGAPSQTYNDVYRSSGDLSTWTKISNAPWHSRHTFGIAKIDSTLFVVGGDYQNYLFDVWSSTDGETWTQKSAALNSVLGNRILYGACSHNGNLYVLGGQNDITDISYANRFEDVWRSPDGINWTQIVTNQDFLGKNISGACTSFNGKIWVIGGGVYDNYADSATRWTNEVWSSPDGITWEQQPNAPFGKRVYDDVIVWDDKLWMIGGSDSGGNFSDIWYMTKKGVWRQFKDIPYYSVGVNYAGRHATGVGVYNNKLVITCGNYNNDCWVIEKKIS